jgi:hypothetical protein
VGLAELGEAGGDAADLAAVRAEGACTTTSKACPVLRAEVRDQPQPAPTSNFSKDTEEAWPRGMALPPLALSAANWASSGIAFMDSKASGTSTELSSTMSPASRPPTAHRGGQPPHADAGGPGGRNCLVPVHGREDEDDGNRQRDGDQRREVPNQPEQKISDYSSNARVEGQELRIYGLYSIRQQHQSHERQQGQGEDLGPLGEDIAVQEAHWFE